MGADLAFHEGEEIFFRVKGELPGHGFGAGTSFGCC